MLDDLEDLIDDVQPKPISKATSSVRQSKKEDDWGDDGGVKS